MNGLVAQWFLELRVHVYCVENSAWFSDKVFYSSRSTGFEALDPLGFSLKCP